MPLTRTLHTLLLLALAGLVSACGFSLRGSDNVSGHIPELQLNLQQPNSDLSRRLRRELESARVSYRPVDLSVPDPAVPILTLDAEQFTSRPVTVNPRARAAQYELSLSVSVTVHWQGQAVLGPETLTTERLFYENIETITGNLEEMQTLQGDMQQELLSQLMRRLAALDPQAGPA